MTKEEYSDLMDYMERMKESIEVLSNNELVKELNSAIKRIESGELLTEQEIIDWNAHTFIW